MRLPQRQPALVVALALTFAACSDRPSPVAPPTTDTDALALRGGSAPPAPQSFTLGAPLFGLNAGPHGGLLASVASAGVIGIAGHSTQTLAALPGVSDAASTAYGRIFAITGGSEDPSQILPTSRKLFRIVQGETREVADLNAFEEEVNPDGFWHTGNGAVLSNPFDLALLSGGRVLVADAAANDVLIVKPNGDVDWVAVLTPVTPGGPEPVPTSVAVGPDGAYYVGELTGFPGPRGLSRVWRIKRGNRHVVCPSSACTLVADGFTSIIDLAFGDDGRLYVVEFDEAGWLAIEPAFARTEEGGTLNACNVWTGACTEIARGLALPTSIAVDKHGTLWIAEHPQMLFAGATVRALCDTRRGGGNAFAHGGNRLPRCGRLTG
jgi:hypothetical protein